MASQPLGRSGVRITKHRTHPKEDAMPTSRFIQRFGDRITGVLSGFDRLVLRGSLLAIVSVQGMKRLLWLKHVWLKDFGRWAQQMTEQLKQASCQAARDQNRPIVYLRSANTDQSWLPFSIQVCINGREWLARMMDHNHVGYRRHDNCFMSIDDVAKAQRLMNRQLRISWPKALQRIVRQLNPLHGQMFRGLGISYYWSI